MYEALEVSKWYRNHQVPYEYAELKRRQLDMYKRTIALSLPVPTRWQSNATCLQALLDSREALEATTVLPSVTEMLRKNAAGTDVRRLVLDTDWWSEVSTLQRIVKLFCARIIELESNMPRLSKLYVAYSSLLQTVQSNVETAELKLKVLQIINKRWRKMNCVEMMLAAHLDLSLKAPYKPAPMDRDSLSSTLQRLQRRFGDSDGKAKLVYRQLVEFQARTGDYQDQVLLEIGADMEPLLWWSTHYKNVSIHPSSGAAERNWSTFGYIHSKSRNRLLNERVEKLDYIYTNERLLLTTPAPETKWFDEDEVPEIDIMELPDVPSDQEDDDDGLPPLDLVLDYSTIFFVTACPPPPFTSFALAQNVKHVNSHPFHISQSHM